MLSPIKESMSDHPNEGPGRYIPHLIRELEKAITIVGKSIEEVAIELGISLSNLYKWRNGDVIPEPVSVQKIHHYFNKIGYIMAPAPPGEDELLETLRKEKRKKKQSDRTSNKRKLGMIMQELAEGRVALSLYKLELDACIRKTEENEKELLWYRKELSELKAFIKHHLPAIKPGTDSTTKKEM